MKLKLSFPVAIAMALSISSCVKDEVNQVVKQYSDADYAKLTKVLDLPTEAHQYTIDLPPSLGGFSVFANDHQATLGRVLFYDKRLSSNGEVSCASCHKADKAFADDVAGSLGVTTERTSRNSLALGAFPSFNGYYGFGGGTRMFWDNRAGSVAEQTEETMKNPVEMGNTDLHSIASELLEEDYYQILFEKAFPNDNYTSDKDKMLQAIQAFVNAIACFDTKYDHELEKNNGRSTGSFAGFTAEENLGKQLFENNCASCHNLGPGFTTIIVAANNGLDMNYTDKGMGAISNSPSEDGLFKVPMLRNVALAAPYMHDGRFATLEEVVEHYNSGIKNHPNLHENLRNAMDGSPKNLNLSEGEKAALVAFLHTLTDKESLQHPRFSNPFK